MINLLKTIRHNANQLTPRRKYKGREGEREREYGCYTKEVKHSNATMVGSWSHITLLRAIQEAHWEKLSHIFLFHTYQPRFPSSQKFLKSTLIQYNLWNSIFHHCLSFLLTVTQPTASHPTSIARSKWPLTWPVLASPTCSRPLSQIWLSMISSALGTINSLHP